MPPQRNLPATLLILLALLAIGGGLATAVLTSPQSFDLSRLAFLQASVTPANTAAPTGTDSPTPPPPTGTPDPTRAVVLPIYLPTDTESPAQTPVGTDTPGPSPTLTATNFPLPLDVWALARVSDLVGATLVRVHDVPNGSQLVAAIPAGTVLQVLYGQAVVEGVTWLEVRLANGRTGWVADYLLIITLQRPAGTGTLVAFGTPATDTPAPAATATNGNAPPPKTGVPAPSQTASPAPTVGPGTTTVPPSPTHAPTAAPTNTPTIAVIVIDTNTPAPATVTNTPVPPPSATPVPTDTTAPQDTDTPVPLPTDTPVTPATATDAPTP